MAGKTTTEPRALTIARFAASFVLVATVLAAVSWWGAATYKRAVVAMALACLRGFGIQVDVGAMALTAPIESTILASVLLAAPNLKLGLRLISAAAGVLSLFLLDVAAVAFAVVAATARQGTGTLLSVLELVAAAAPSVACALACTWVLSRLAYRGLRRPEGIQRAPTTPVRPHGVRP